MPQVAEASEKGIMDRDREGGASPGVHVVGTLTIAWALAYLDRMIIGILIPSLKHDLNITDTQASLLQGFAFALFFVLAGLSIGRLVDRYNRRNIIMIGILFWSTATIFCGLASSFAELFAARLGVGIGEACLAPAAMSLLADYCAPGKSGRAMGIVTAGAPVGTAGSSFVGGFLLDLFDGHAIAFPILGLLQPWQMVFLCLGLPGYLVALLVLTIREPARRQAVSSESGSVRDFARLLARDRAVMLPFFLFLACNFVVGTGFASWVAVAMMRSFSLSPGIVGAYIGIILLVSGTAGSVIGGFLSDKLLLRWPLDGRLRVSWIVYPIIMLSIAGFLVAPSYFAALVFVAGFFIGSNMIYAASFPAVAEIFPSEARGQAIGFFLLIGNLAGYGIAGTLIALTTDQIFADEMQVRASMVAVCLPFSALAVLFGTMAMKAYARRRAELISATAASLEAGASHGQAVTKGS